MRNIIQPDPITSNEIIPIPIDVTCRLNKNLAYSLLPDKQGLGSIVSQGGG